MLATNFKAIVLFITKYWLELMSLPSDITRLKDVYTECNEVMCSHNSIHLFTAPDISRVTQLH